MAATAKLVSPGYRRAIAGVFAQPGSRGAHLVDGSRLAIGGYRDIRLGLSQAAVPHLPTRDVVPAESTLGLPQVKVAGDPGANRAAGNTPLQEPFLDPEQHPCRAGPRRFAPRIGHLAPRIGHIKTRNAASGDDHAQRQPKLVRSSRLGLSWADGALVEGCPQVKRFLPTFALAA